MKVLAASLTMALTLTLASAGAFAQRGGDREPRNFGGKNQGMSKDQRERMRQDMRNVYQDRGAQNRPPPQRQMSPEEREKLRRDIQDANKNLRR